MSIPRTVQIMARERLILALDELSAQNEQVAHLRKHLTVAEAKSAEINQEVDELRDFLAGDMEPRKISPRPQRQGERDWLYEPPTKEEVSGIRAGSVDVGLTAPKFGEGNPQIVVESKDDEDIPF